ncbi:SE1626 family protein [Staphylococcus lutrae]|uniref:SE1626 family protein n=1 Tax=Staphylococcus lutrae TaxID=155085 RepID=UPI00146D6714|nr:hypothetical protein [Staphylococcus lutrae]
MKYATQTFVIIAIASFVVGVVFQYLDEESSAVKLFIASILFMVCAFINRQRERKNQHK